MVELNKNAAEAMNTIGVNACTDITGYGLLGHLLEMCKASNVSAYLKYKEVPIIPGVKKLIEKGFIPGGTKKNLNHAIKTIKQSPKISQNDFYLLADAQTSGGLLISVKSERAHQLQKLLNKFQLQRCDKKV